VDELVHELAARGRDVPVRRRQGVAARHVEAVHGAKVTGADATSRFLEPSVETALEADLHPPPFLLDMVHDAFGRLEVERDRLLAEDREPFVERADDEIGMRSGRSDDHGRIRTIESGVDRLGVLGAELLREACRTRSVDVVDPKLVDPR
jgi:hypothetical protein